ncbi:hypothetical protein BSKO_07522 [Bryopsis sp. KO-2023]|nr:hypothetical protein BSKO_07522 [Bryopsis sp. KO-2023]
MRAPRFKAAMEMDSPTATETISSAVRSIVTESEELCRALVRECFLLYTALLDFVISCLVGGWDCSYKSRVRGRQEQALEKRRFWAMQRESSLNSLITVGSCGSSDDCDSDSISEESSSSVYSSPRCAPNILRLPTYPLVHMDVMGSVGRGTLDDMQLVVELSVSWVFKSIKKGNICVPRKLSLPCPAGWEPVQTAADVIKVSGYPLEVHKVCTRDGYIITMHRIPRPASKKATFFLHGMLDSSICWVAGGVTSSPAFEAYNQGYDVWLGNSRNTPPREHVNPEMQSGLEYWKFTINELGEVDVKAFVEHIDAVKRKELGRRQSILRPASESNHQRNNSGKTFRKSQNLNFGLEESDQGYSLSAVGHSLGCASILIHVISSLRKGKLHGFDRLVLLAPAGFHRHLPPMAFFSNYFLKPLAWCMINVFRLPGFGVQMPSGLLRLLAFKFLHDFKRVPALGEIARRFMEVWTCDGSAWNKAACAPHYSNPYTPGISLHTGLHMVQWFHTGKFEMYDYGSRWGNLVHYGRTTPLNVSDEYHRIDVPVDFMSGKSDGVISHKDVQIHFQEAKKRGVDCRYWEFNHSHLDFSMCMKTEVLDAMMACLKRKT